MSPTSYQTAPPRAALGHIKIPATATRANSGPATMSGRRRLLGGQGRVGLAALTTAALVAGVAAPAPRLRLAAQQPAGLLDQRPSLTVQVLVGAELAVRQCLVGLGEQVVRLGQQARGLPRRRV